MKRYLFLLLACFLFSCEFVACQPRATYDNNIGEQDIVLPPWTPMVATETQVESSHELKVECWGRTYIFDQKYLLPYHIISQNTGLLSAPVALKMLAGSANVQWGNNDLKLISRSPTKVNLSISASALNVPNLKISVLYLIEYDGLMQVEVRLSNPNSVNIDIENIDIPLNSSNAEYIHRNVSRKEVAGRQVKAWKSGALKKSTGVIDNTDFVPFVWLGNDDLGLFWFCETPVNWPIYTSVNAEQIIRSGDGNSVTLRLNLNDRQNLTRSDWDFKFGFQATPVKSLSKGWRNWRIMPAPNPNIVIIWPAPDNTSLKYFGYPEAADPDVFKKRVDGYHRQGLKVIPYSCLAALSTAAPEWDRVWDIGYRSQVTSDTRAFNAPFVRINPLSKSYSNFIIQKTQKFFNDYNLDGFYCDISTLININFHQVVKHDNDSTRTVLPFFPILGLRDLYRREYSFIKQQNPNTIIIQHTSTSIVPPILGYADAYLDGEQFRVPWLQVGDSYADALPLDEFRTEFTGRQFGTVPIFLPEFKPESSKKPEPTRNLIGMILLNDVLCWPLLTDIDEWKAEYSILGKYDLSEAEFISYHNSTPPVISPPLNKTYVSLYKLPSGKTIVIAANLSHVQVSGVVKLNPVYLGRGSFTIKALPGNQVVSNNNSLSLSLSPSQYSVFVIEP